jgi:hypothetical protein
MFDYEENTEELAIEADVMTELEEFDSIDRWTDADLQHFAVLAAE